MKADSDKLNRAFNPQCVVVVGDKQDANFRWLRAQGSFKGKLYSVQVNPKTIEGIKALGIENYTSLLDIPDTIDLVIAVVSRTVAINVLEDCIRKEVAAAQFFASGFSETGTEEGIKLERLLSEKAEKTSFQLIGPNCLGIFNPKVGVRQTERQYSGITGSVGFISQSGSHAVTFAEEAHLQGVEINKSVNFGNGIVLDSADFLEYFSSDPEIKAIGMYLEGVKDGRRFFKVLKEVSGLKPVVVWKGGRTEEGTRAIASHTGALAIHQAIWDTAVAQCGATKVTSMEELIDTLKALLYLSPVYGDRVAVVGGSGGQSVAITDIFAEVGLKVPELTQESYDKLAPFFSLIGGSYCNPVDTGSGRHQLASTLEILEQDTNTDNLVLLARFRSLFGNPQNIEDDIALLDGIRKRESKTVLAILPYSTPEDMEKTIEITRKFQDVSSIPIFPSAQRGALALRNALNYYRLKSRFNG
ncbi:CoA-binding protein [Chloroflexota bacterium]